MAFPAAFDESNGVLSKPESLTHEQCEALSVWRGPNVDGENVVISCWKLTKEELDEINRTGRLWLIIWGGTMPPSCIMGTRPFIEVK